MVRRQVKRRTSLLMGISLALLLGAAAAFFVFALPQYLLERLTVLSGLSRVMVQAEPPISSNDRALLAALAGIGTMGLGWVLIDWLLLGRAGMSVLIRPREDDFEDDEEGYRPADPLDLVTPAPRAVEMPMPMPAVNPADPRKPLSARTDIGDPPPAPAFVPPVFAPSPVPMVGRQDIGSGQTLPPLDQLFAEAARAPTPAPPIFPPARPEIAPQPPAPAPAARSPQVTPDLAGEDLLNPADIFRGLTVPPVAPQMPQAPAAPPPLPDDFWTPPQVRTVSEPLPQPITVPEPVAPPAATIPQPPAPVPAPRAEATPDMRMESFPPNLPDLPDSPFFTSPPPPVAAAPVFVPPAEAEPVAPAFVPPPEPEPIAWRPEPAAWKAEPEPEPVATPDPVSEPVTYWTPPAPVLPVVQPPAATAPPAPPAEDMPLEDMLARLELGMQKRREAAASPAAAEPPRRPLPAYAAAQPVREVPPPPVMAVVPPVAPAPEPAWTPPVSAVPASAADGDGLLDQPLHVALGVLRNLVRG